MALVFIRGSSLCRICCLCLCIMTLIVLPMSSAISADNIIPLPSVTADYMEQNIHITLLSQLETKDYILSARLSPTNRYLAVYEGNGSLTIYSLSQSMDIEHEIFSTKGKNFVVDQYAWAGNTLLLSVIQGTKEWLKVHDNPELLNTAVIRTWKPGTHKLQSLLPYSAEIILPDRVGNKIALFNRTNNKKNTSKGNIPIVIYDLKKKRVINIINIRATEVDFAQSIPIGWGNDAREIYIIKRNLIGHINSSQLLSIDLKGKVHYLTPPSEEIAGQYYSSVLAFNQWELPGLTQTHGRADYIAALGDVSFPTIHIGYFQEHRMVMDYTVPIDNTPTAWKQSKGERFTISPDGEHIIFQSTTEFQTIDSINEYMIYCWNTTNGSIQIVGRYPLLYQVGGWTDNVLIFLVDTKKSKSTIGFIKIENY